MHPDDNRSTTPIIVPPRQAGVPSVRDEANKAAAQRLIREQINKIYRDDPNTTMPAKEAAPIAATPSTPTTTTLPPIQPGPGAVNMQVANQQAEVENPYERTHDETQHQLQAAAWQKYHSAWQSYYQQYYERYYLTQVNAVKRSLVARTQAEHHTPAQSPKDQTISTNEAMRDLRSKLRDSMTERAKKVRKSRHFVPIIAALVVMLLFTFLQYNRVVFAAINAYVTPSEIDPSTLLVDPSTSATVSSDPVLIVPKIAVDVPIIWNADPTSQSSLDDAMNKGVAWFNIQGAGAKPGEKGNFVLSGHSSNDWLDKGDYKFIFARLDQLTTGDTIYVNYNSVRYTYTVTNKKVVKPTDVSALQVGTDKPRITLITCTPLGTALNRLLVFADQVSPDPTSATQSSTDTASGSTATTMPSNSPTFLERLFGAKE